MFLKIKYLSRHFVSRGRSYIGPRAIWMLLTVSLLLSLNAVHAVQVSDNPMETQVQSGGANIMFVLDNSGSMDWEFMTDATDGKFEGNIEYLFDDPGDNNYPTSDGNGTILSDRGKWKSQWSGYNKIYYDPGTDYLPWPQTTTHQFVNADISNPRSNPADAADTFDLRAQFHLVTSFDGEVIVDNQDSVHFSTTGNGWAESGAGDEYDNSSYYTDEVGDTATWTPDLPVSGTYHVYAWWCYYGTRDTNALYTINHNSGSYTRRINQQVDAGQWVLLATYDFDAGTSGNVTVTRDSASTGSSTSADAVKFVLDGAGPGATVSIKRAHYYTYHDADDDGELDGGENVYLVNFVDSDTDNELDTREYYRVFDMNGDHEIEAGELIEVTDTAEQDLFRPKVFDENGNFVDYKTHAEDLQNFANWYQYYRRRELAAKAVVANAINSMEGVSIGLYSINSGVRQPVLPIKLDMAASVIVDNQDTGFSTTGNDWEESSAGDEYDGSSYYTNDVNDTATWTPNLPATGTYNVYAWWCYWSTRDTNAKYTITHAGGSDHVYVNQQEDTGQWILLGTYSFDAGTTGYVTVTRHSGSTDNSTSADAVMFEQTGGALVNVDETYTLLDQLYAMDSDSSTPLRQALENVGEYFHQDDGSDGGLGSSPFASAADGGACQKAYAILMTDGYWNGSSPGVSGADNDQGDPYEDSYDNTLADVAMYYYKNDLSASLDNVVPTKGCDTANHQHMTTYTLSFGVTGTIDLTDMDGDGQTDISGYADDPCFVNTNTPVPTWPNPADGNAQRIDDLFHAAVNGRGLFFSATNPQELIESMAEIIGDIRDPASGASVSVNGEELGADTVLYQARYISGDWIGEVLAFPIHPTTGAVLNSEDDILWNSAEKLERLAVTWDNRRIVTYNGSNAGTKFRYTDLTTAQQNALKEADWGLGLTQDEQAARILEYVRGRSDNITSLNFRYRTRLLGDIVHSAPVLVGKAESADSDGLDNDDDGFTDVLDPDGERKGGTIFVGGNDGMLHAFDAQNGWERFGFVPNRVFENLKYLKDMNFSHRFYVDLTPYTKEIAISATHRKTYLVGGLGNGGKGYYSLLLRDRVESGGVWTDSMNVDDITDATSEDDLITMGLVQWEYPRADTANDGMDNDGDGSTDEASEIDPDIGYSFSHAYFVKTNSATHRWVVIFGNGYNSVSNKAVLYVLDLNGVLVRKIDTGVSGDNGLSTPALIDVNNDRQLDYVYAGDLKGNMWKFDFTDSDAANWSVAYNDGTNPQPLIATGQPITSKPDVMRHCTEHGYMVIFGTGKYLHNDDRINTDQQTIYGIWDYGDDADDSEYLGTFVPGGFPELSNQMFGVNLLEQTIAETPIGGHAYRTFSDNAANWETADDGDVTQNPNPLVHAGWYVDFPTTPPGERVFKSVQIRDAKAFVISFIPDASPCSGGGNSFLYIMDACAGGRLETGQFEIGTSGNLIQIGIDVHGDPIMAAPTGKAFVGTLHEPKIIRRPGTGLERLYMSSSAGVVETEDLPAERRGVLYWLER